MDGSLLDSMYACVTQDDALPAMLELLAEHFRCTSAVLLYVDEIRPEAAVSLGYGLIDEDAQQRYRDHYAAEDPAPAAMARLPVGTATTTDRLFDPARQASSRFLREYYHPLGLREALGGPIIRDGRQFGVLAVHRGPDREPFRDDEVVAFEQMMPHVARALILRRAFFEMETQARVLEGALEASPTAVMTFDQRGVLYQANAAARAILARKDGLILSRSGFLEAFDRKARDQLQSAFTSVAYSKHSIVLRVPRKAQQHAYTVRIVASQPEMPPGFICHISDPDPVAGDLPSLLAGALKLKLGSARLVAGLLNGDDLSSYAKKSGISLNTAKFHLKAAFAATGTQRQVDLVLLAGAVARDLGRDPLHSGADLKE